MNSITQDEDNIRGRREPWGYCTVCLAKIPWKLGLCRVHRKYYDFEGKRLEKEIRLNHEWKKLIKYE